jgi:hypothetical protein
VRNTIGCSTRTSSGDVRVNQDCTYRPQAEEKIVYNPANPSHLIAGQNDARVGFNQCSIAWSLLNQNIVTSHYQPLVFPCEYRIRCSARP